MDVNKREMATGVRILLVDIDYELQSSLKSMSPKNWDLVIAGTGLDAVHAWESGSFDVIVIGLGVLVGAQISRLIVEREKKEKRRHTPILALFSIPPDVDQTGIDDFLGEPVSVKDLLRRIEMLLERERVAFAMITL